MAQIPPFKKFNRSKLSWANYKHGELGNHIQYCESHIERCELLIAELNGNFQVSEIVKLKSKNSYLLFFFNSV